MSQPGARRPLRVLYFGSYDRGVGRNLVVQEALAVAGASVAECHARVWRDTASKLEAFRQRAPWRVPLRQAWAWTRLLRAYRTSGPYDILVVGATAHLDVPLARMLASAAGRPLVFDPLVSAYETVRDRALTDSAARQQALAALERVLLRLPDRVLVDTLAHARALHEEVALDLSRAIVVPAGAPAEIRRRAEPYDTRRGGPERPLRVLYFGQYIPLHGVDVLLRAAHALRRRDDLVFDLVGIGQELDRSRALARDLGLDNVRFHDTWLPPAALAERYIAGADLCVGVFGREPKAARVVPFKVYTALASGRPVITADTPAVREMLRPDLEVCTVPPADPVALAEAIRRLADRPAVRGDLAAFGLAAYDRRFAPSVIGPPLVAELERASMATRLRPFVGPRHAWRTERVAVALVAAAPAGPLLDVGCKDADLTRTLAASGRRVTGVDRDLPRLRVARPATESLVCADIRALPFAAGSIAGIAAGEVLEHVSDDARAATEMARVLAPGGALVATVPAGPDRFDRIDVAAGHHRRYDRSGLARLLQGAGLRVTALRETGFPFGRLYDRWVQRPALAARRAGARALLSGIAASGPVRRLWRALFALDERLRLPGAGSGILAVAIRPDADGGQPGSRPTDPTHRDDVVVR